jgi:hypothetical protein
MTVIGALSSFREPGEISPHKRASSDQPLLVNPNCNHSSEPDWHSGSVRSPIGRLRQCDSSDLSTLVSFKTSSRRAA